MSTVVNQDTQQGPADRCCSDNGREIRDFEDGPVLHLHNHRSMETGKSVGKSACFLDLKFGADPEARGDAIWDMVQHMRGDRHRALCYSYQEGRPRGYGESVTERIDPVGNCLKTLTVKESYEPLNEDEANQYEQILRDAYNGVLGAVMTSYDKVEQLRKPKLNPLYPIGTIAAVMGNLPVVQFVLRKGAVMNRDLAFAIQLGAAKDPDMKEFYEKNSEWLNELIEAPFRPPPGYTPNVSDERSREIDGFLGR